MANMPIAMEQQSTIKSRNTLALVAVFITYFSSSYIFRGVTVASPKIAAELNGMALYSWAISLPALGAAFITLICGRLSDMYGRRLMLSLCLLLYLAGALLAAFSETFRFYIFARIILSLGQGALSPLCFSVIGDLFPPAQRSRWSGLLQIPAGIAAVVVPTSVGILTDTLSWRYYFFIAVLLALVCGAFVVFGIPSLSKKSEHKIDFLGSCLLAVASSAMILAFSWAGSQYAWTSIQIIGLLTVSAVFWVVFLWCENRAEEPMLDPQVLTNRTFLTAAVAAFASYFGVLGIQMYYPLFLQGVQGTSATLSGQIITPFSMLMAFIGVPTGFLLAWTKRCKWMYIIGYGILTVTSFGMVAFHAGTPLWLGILVTALAGLGIGAIPTMNTLVAQFAVPKRLLGVSVGAMFFFVFLGGAIAPAVLGSAMNAEYAKKLKASVPAELSLVADEATLKSLADPRVLLSQSAMNTLRKDFEGMDGKGNELFNRTVQAIRDSLEAGLKTIFAIGAVSMLLSFLLILTIPEVSMDTEVKDKKRP
jgi:MFS family permease